jgi:hypothetical protein
MSSNMVGSCSQTTQHPLNLPEGFLELIYRQLPHEEPTYELSYQLCV